jgi:hypothetical protein
MLTGGMSREGGRRIAFEKNSGRGKRMKGIEMRCAVSKNKTGSDLKSVDAGKNGEGWMMRGARKH